MYSPASITDLIPIRKRLKMFGKMSRTDFLRSSSLMSCTLLTNSGVLNTITACLFIPFVIVVSDIKSSDIKISDNNFQFDEPNSKTINRNGLGNN
ncbi:hypothetical protein ACTXT7_000602 [Hymenolepis weldensis]